LRPALFLCLALALALGPPSPAPAQDRNGDRVADQAASFTIRLRGVPAGVFHFAATEQDGRYAARARVETTGLAALLRKVRLRATVEGEVGGEVGGQVGGQVGDDRLWPRRYAGAISTGRRDSEAELRYAGGVPRLIRYASPDPVGPDSPAPETQGGTVDPMTALYTVLRAVPADRACDRTIEMFDGKRRSRVILDPPRRAAAELTCAGRYLRIAGFRPEEIAEKRRFDFRLVYRVRADDRVKAMRVEVETLYGPARLDRR